MSVTLSIVICGQHTARTSHAIRQLASLQTRATNDGGVCSGRVQSTTYHDHTYACVCVMSTSRKRAMRCAYRWPETWTNKPKLGTPATWRACVQRSTLTCASTRHTSGRVCWLRRVSVSVFGFLSAYSDTTTASCVMELLRSCIGTRLARSVSVRVIVSL